MSRLPFTTALPVLVPIIINNNIIAQHFSAYDQPTNQPTIKMFTPMLKVIVTKHRMVFHASPFLSASISVFCILCGPACPCLYLLAGGVPTCWITRSIFIRALVIFRYQILLKYPKIWLSNSSF